MARASTRALWIVAAAAAAAIAYRVWRDRTGQRLLDDARHRAQALDLEDELE